LWGVKPTGSVTGLSSTELSIEFLLGAEAQQHIVNTTFEYPIIDQVMPNTIMAAFGTSFKQDTTSVATYYNNQAQALSIMKKAGWR